MAGIDIATLRSAIRAAGATWEAIELPPGAPRHGLGWHPAPPETMRLALANAQRLMVTRMPQLFLRPMRDPGLGAAPAAGPAAAHPSSFDWRSRNAIGPVTDQAWCGSCVSFACPGLVGAMVAIEQGLTPVHLSEAD